MALFQAQLGTSDTSVFNPSANSAVTTMFICNTHTAAITVTIHLINGSGTPDDTDIFITEFAALGTEIGETVAVAVGDADGTSLTSNGDKHVQLKLTNPSGTVALAYSGVAHLVEVPGDS